MKIELEKIDKKINDEETEEVLRHILEIMTGIVNKLDDLGKRMDETSKSMVESIRVLRKIRED